MIVNREIDLNDKSLVDEIIAHAFDITSNNNRVNRTYHGTEGRAAMHAAFEAGTVKTLTDSVGKYTMTLSDGAMFSFSSSGVR
jgi:hypothetical protein